MMVSNASEPQINALPASPRLMPWCPAKAHPIRARPAAAARRRPRGRPAPPPAGAPGREAARAPCELRHGAAGKIREPRATALLAVGDHLRPHARLPVALEVIGDGARGLLGLRGAGEEVAYLVRPLY